MSDLNENELLPEDNPVKRKSWTFKAGIFLVIMSFVLYAGILLVPMTPYSLATKAVIATTLAVAGEISFWVGGLLLGKELVTKYRGLLNPMRWFKKKDNP
ncbi:MAG: transporter suffix domain-containing protein [Bacillota bacterium]